MHATMKKQVGSYTKSTTPFHSKRLQKLCGNGKLFEYVLPRITEIIKTYIQLDQKRETHLLGEKNNKTLLMKLNAD